jgi:hypothetical protein
VQLQVLQRSASPLNNRCEVRTLITDPLNARESDRASQWNSAARESAKAELSFEQSRDRFIASISSHISTVVGLSDE